VTPSAPDSLRRASHNRANWGEPQASRPQDQRGTVPVLSPGSGSMHTAHSVLFMITSDARGRRLGTGMVPTRQERLDLWPTPAACTCADYANVAIDSTQRPAPRLSSWKAARLLGTVRGQRCRECTDADNRPARPKRRGGALTLGRFLNGEAREGRRQDGAPGGHAAYLSRCHVHLQERSNSGSKFFYGITAAKR